MVKGSSSYFQLLVAWFLCSLFIIRVPFFLLFGFSKGGPTMKRAKGYQTGTLEFRIWVSWFVIRIGLSVE